MKYAILTTALLTAQVQAWEADNYGFGYIGPLNSGGPSTYITQGRPNTYRFDNGTGATYLTPGQPNTYRFDTPSGSTYITPGQPNTYRFD